MADSGPKKKGGLSSRLLQMRFMQRAKEKEKLTELREANDQKKQEEEWQAEQAAKAVSKGCVVVVEGDPPPGAVVGRLSFGAFNPHTERVAAEAEAVVDARDAARDAQETALNREAPVVSDAEMAARLGGKGGGGKGGGVVAGGVGGVKRAAPKSGGNGGVEVVGRQKTPKKRKHG